MTLAGFKAIFFWEYVHRLLGRVQQRLLQDEVIEGVPGQGQLGEDRDPDLLVVQVAQHLDGLRLAAQQAEALHHLFPQLDTLKDFQSTAQHTERHKPPRKLGLHLPARRQIERVEEA